MSYVITVDDVERVSASIVVEAANVATLADAEAALLARGSTVVPDFVANVGTNAWWWWVGFGDIEPTPGSAFAKLSAVLRPLTHEILDNSALEDVSPRAAATEISNEKRAPLDDVHPRTVSGVVAVS